MSDTNQVSVLKSSAGATENTNQGSVNGHAACNMGTALVDAVKETAGLLLTEQKDRAADQIGSVAALLRNSVESLDEKKRGPVAGCTEIAAEEIEQFAEKVRHTSWGVLAADAEAFGRRWPVAFMISAIGAGFVAGRLLMSSESRSGKPDRGEQPSAAAKSRRAARC
jgi:hypothetical protein